MGREARANQIGPVFFGVPFSKVDVGARTVTGIVSDEVLDRQNEITDFDTIKAFLTDDKLWPGNIREQHDPKKPCGSKVEVSLDDVGKVATLTAYVSEACPDTWTKCVDGTLKGFSIGGTGRRVVEKIGDRAVKRLFMEQLSEVSLVDNPANPHSLFTVAKSIDGVMVDVEPAASTEIVDPVAKAAAAVDAAIETAKPAPVVYVIGSIRKMVAELARGAERDVRKSAVIAAAVADGPEAIAELPFAWQPEAVRKGSPEPYDIDRAMSAISTLEWLLSTEYYDVVYSQPAGVTPDPAKVAQVATIKAAIDAVLRFVMMEHEAQFTPDANGQGGLDVELDDVVVELFVKSLDAVQKSGARHSKSDVDMIQKVHDLSGSLGANCHTDDAEKVAKAAAEAKAAADVPPPASESSTDVQKLTSELEATKAELVTLKATAADQAKADAEVKKRLEALEAQPMPGGPVRSAHATVVEKEIGGPSSQPATEHTQVLKVFETLAKDATSDEERLRIATKQMEYRHANGLDHVDMLSGRPVTASA